MHWTFGTSGGGATSKLHTSFLTDQTEGYIYTHIEEREGPKKRICNRMDEQSHLSIPAEIGASWRKWSNSHRQ